MRRFLLELTARIAQTGLEAAEGFPNAAWPHVDRPLAAVMLEHMNARPAGLGEAACRLCEMVFHIAVYDRTADGCLTAVSKLTPLLPGLSVAGSGAVFDPDTQAYVLHCRLPQTAWLTPEETADAPVLVFDWKGEIIHECHS